MSLLKAFVDINWSKFPIKISPVLRGTWIIRTSKKRTVIEIEEKNVQDKNEKVMHTYSGESFPMKYGRYIKEE